MDLTDDFEEKISHYTEVARIVSAHGSDKLLTNRGIFKKLSETAIGYVKKLPCGYDEKPMDIFMGDALEDDVVTYNTAANRYELGQFGRVLLNRALEGDIQ